MDLRERGFEDGIWMELVQDRVKLRDLVLAVLDLDQNLTSLLQCCRIGDRIPVLRNHTDDLLVHVSEGLGTSAAKLKILIPNQVGPI
jgi:hypothetical protein